METFYEIMKKWEEISKKLPMTINWEDIKEGMTYHIPPVLNKKRSDFKILSKNNYWVRVQYLGQSEKEFGYIYDYDMESKFITKTNN